ncbi:MAG: molybdopterin-guanine dinucleotide biosynthesis protein B [Clostridiales bacterium]|nr:molybdopterin-guanine dinucleotide biosynthesis protein B [Clostridiales bacterium]
MPEIPVWSLVALSHTGKTTFLERLIPALGELGLSVGVVKHDAHGFQMDYPGKDSNRLTQAGAAVTAVVSPARAAFLENRPLSPEEAVGRIRGVDLILTEGFKTGPWPKLALCRAGSAPAVPLERCAALVTDAPPEDCPVPVFPIQDPMPLARWLARQRKERE